MLTTFAFGGEITAGDGIVTVTGGLGIHALVPGDSVDQIPVGTPKSVSLPEDGRLTITLAGTDGDADALTVFPASRPAHGEIYQTSDGVTLGERIEFPPTKLAEGETRVIYVPHANYSGSDSFTFKANDGKANSPAAVVTISVTPDQDPPLVKGDTYTAAYVREMAALPVLLNDWSADSLVFNIVAVTQGAHGTVSINPSGRTLRYVPSTYLRMSL